VGNVSKVADGVLSLDVHIPGEQSHYIDSLDEFH